MHCVYFCLSLVVLDIMYIHLVYVLKYGVNINLLKIAIPLVLELTTVLIFYLFKTFSV